MKRRILALLSALALIFVLAAACGDSGGTQQPDAPSNGSGGGGGSSDPVTPAEPVTTDEAVHITFLVLGNRPTNGRMEAAVAAANEIMKEKINTTYELQYIEWADWQTQYQLALTGGDSSIDIIVSSTTWLYAWQMVGRGAFTPLSEEMIKTYAPQTWANIPSENWEEVTLDGTIWFIPEDQYSQWTNHGMYWRKDWAALGGVDSVTNFNDLGRYLAAVKEHQPDAVPWDIGAADNYAGLLPGYITDNSTRNAILGCETGNYNIFYYDSNDPYTVSSPVFDDVFVDGAKLMKEWGDAGYWREDVLNYTAETRDLFFGGFSGADQHHVETYIGSIRPRMDEENPGSETEMFWWGMENGNYDHDLITHQVLAVSAFSKNPERGLMVYDLLRNDPEIYLLHNFGIEGVDYINNGDGTFSRPEGFDPATDNLDTNFWAGRNDNLHLVDANRYAGWRDLFVTLDEGSKTYPLAKFIFDIAPVQAELAAIADVCSMHYTSIAYGKAGDPEAAVEAFRNDLLAAGYEKVLAEIQTQLDALKARS